MLVNNPQQGVGTFYDRDRQRLQSEIRAAIETGGVFYAKPSERGAIGCPSLVETTAEEIKNKFGVDLKIDFQDAIARVQLLNEAENFQAMRVFTNEGSSRCATEFGTLGIKIKCVEAQIGQCVNIRILRGEKGTWLEKIDEPSMRFLVYPKPNQSDNSSGFNSESFSA